MRIRCLIESCENEPREQWFIKTESGFVERLACWVHAVDLLPSDRAAFGDAFIMGSGVGAE